MNWLSEKKSERYASLQGYLWKMKRHIKLHLPQWNKRWFAVEGRYLKWYSSESSSQESGSIKFENVVSISAFESGQQGVYSFVIVTADRTMFLRAESAKVMEKWLRIAQMQTDLVRGGNGTSLVTESTSTNKIVTKKINSIPKMLDEVSDALDKLETTEKSEMEAKEYTKTSQAYQSNASYSYDDNFEDSLDSIETENIPVRISNNVSNRSQSSKNSSKWV